MQGTSLRSLVREDPTRGGATKPVEQLSPCAATTEPTCPTARALQQEERPRSLHTATKSRPCSRKPEEAGVQQSRQHGRKIKDLKKTKESLKEGMNEWKNEEWDEFSYWGGLDIGFFVFLRFHWRQEDGQNAKVALTTSFSSGTPPWTLVWSSRVSQAFRSVQTGSRWPGVKPAVSHSEWQDLEQDLGGKPVNCCSWRPQAPPTAFP